MSGLKRFVSRLRGGAVVALVSVVAVLTTAVAPPVAMAGVAPAAVTADDSVVRWGGSDRYAVSAEISRMNFDPGVGTVYVANGLAYADALAAGPVAGVTEGPILLVKKDSIPETVTAELERLDPTRIVVLGGLGSVSATVEAKLGSYASDVVRWGGADRYAVSANIAAINIPDWVSTVYVANGLASADALAAGPVAGINQGPILLVKKDSIPETVAAELNRMTIRKIVVLGGVGSVSAAVESKLRTFAGSVVRWGGADRYEVSANVSQESFVGGASTVYVANGLASADALAAGPVAGRNRSTSQGPILLVKKDSIPSKVATELARLKPERIVVLGGTGSVSAIVERALSGYVVPVAPLTVTTTTLPAGTAGSAYPDTLLTASGGVAPYTWSATGLPAGLTLSVGGILSGIPTATGQFELSVAVTDASSTASETLWVEVLAPPVVTWGQDGFFEQKPVPVGLADVTAIEAGGFYSLALKDDGTIVGWGSAEVKTPPESLTGVTALAAGYNHALALTEDGNVVGWGWDDYGQATVPAGLTGVTAIAAGYIHSLASRADGSVVAWGSNNNGEATVPVGLTGVTAVSAGMYHSLALVNDGTVAIWGRTAEGQSAVPADLADVTAIAAGDFHSLALRSDGTVVAWGANEYGQATVPVGLNAVTAIAAGSNHSVALRRDGTVVAWGANEYGQATVPPDLTGATAIAAGRTHSLAVLAD